MPRLVSRKPTKTKRRKLASSRLSTRELTPDESLYEIRDIIGEKYEKGRLLYRVDWADNPTTGERYDPTWEPAANVTEATVADWKKHKRQQQERQRTSSSTPIPSIEPDGQPVLLPNPRAKRQRDFELSEQNVRASKRPRQSADSGYTSTEAEPQSSWELLSSKPNNKGRLVCELSIPPGFDPSQYLVISSAQSAPASQAVLSNAASSQVEGNRRVTPISQRTIPDSQDSFDSLHTLFTQSDSGTSPSRNPSQPAVAAQEVENQQQGSNSEGQASRSEVEIPSRQVEAPQGSRRSFGIFESLEAAQASQLSSSRPQELQGDQEIPSRQIEGLHQTCRQSFGLFEASEAVQATQPRSSKPQEQRVQEIPPEDSPWGAGFLTQPAYDLPASCATTESSQTLKTLTGVQELVQNSQGNEPTRQSGTEAENYYSLPASASRLCEAAQEVSLPEINTGQILTQSSAGIRGSNDDPFETPRRARAQSAVEVIDQLLSSPLGERTGLAHSHTSSVRALSLSIPAPENNSLPAAPRNQIMDGTPQETPRSAVDIVQQLGFDVFGACPDVDTSAESKLGTDLVSPSAVLPGMDHFAQHLEESSAAHLHEPPAQDASSNNHPFGLGLNLPHEHTGHGMEFEQQPTTVAPADLTTSIEHLHGGDEDLSTDHQFLGAPEQSAVSADIQPDHFPLHMEEEDEDEEEALSRHFTVTLPMAANTRSIYLDTIAENKPTMIEFGQFFSEELVPDGPDASLVAKMDIIFEKLLNLCDLPAYDDSLPALSKEEIRKHATNSNSKYSFVYEFLHGLDDINTRIMILSQPGRVFECLEAVISASGFPYTVFGQDGSGQTMDSDGSSVVLAVAGQDLSRIRGGIDVVIAFDHVARSIDLPANLGYESMPPMILSLVTTYSLEHIDQQLQSEPGLDVLERKNALNLATGAAREHVRNPEYLRDSKGRYLEPHSIAKMFSDFLRDPERGLEWEPHPLPSEIVEVWLSQGQESHDAHQTQILRKRHLDNAIDEGTPKRLRLLESRLPSRTATPAQMSDLLRQTLAKQPVSRAGTPVVEVPVDKLERMASKIAELEARLAKQSDYEAKLRDQVSSLESEVRSHQKTASTLQPRFKEAIGDRGRFEKECQAAVVKMNAASERLETQKADVEALKEKNRALESQLKEANDALANSTVPEAAKVAQAENACAEALAKVEKLEKKLKNLQADAEYARDAYQRASNAHTVLNQENQELSKKVAGLERRASENLLKIHQVHAHNEMSEVARQIDELQALLENRERELDRAKEELKFLKNGRRETRQGSVPRSPRPGVMSPRPCRGVGGAGSRGTSPAPLMSSDGLGSGVGNTPVPGMPFLPGTGGRWGHLRD